jgi:hypothetical protein
MHGPGSQARVFCLDPHLMNFVKLRNFQMLALDVAASRYCSPLGRMPSLGDRLVVDQWAPSVSE